MRGPSRLSEKKWTTFLKDCFDQKEFHFKEMMIKHSVGTGLITTLSDINYVESQGNSRYKWIGPLVLTDNIKKRFCELYREQCRIRNKESRIKRENKEQTIPTLFSQNILSIDSQEAINAIQLLKSLGFRILKPINKFEEI